MYLATDSHTLEKQRKFHACMCCKNLQTKILPKNKGTVHKKMAPTKKKFSPYLVALAVMDKTNSKR